MALSTNTLKLMKVLYWILLSLIHLYIVYILLVSNRTITGIIWLIMGFMLILIMYGVYFPGGDPGSQWPPYISACPDYLSQIAPNACVDYVGLHSRLIKSDPRHPPALTETEKVFNAAGDRATKAQNAQMRGLSWQGIT